MKTDLLVIDAYSLIYRAYYALPPLTNKDGIATNAVYGFINMLLKVIDERNPTSILVAFDSKEKTFRSDIDPEYKAHRPPMPDDLIYQIPIVKEILSAMRIAQISFPGYEADDIIGTVVKHAENENKNSLIVTGDRDALQLVSIKTHVLLTKKGISETIEMSPEMVEEIYSITPEQVTSVKAIMGDKSDNIPGVPNIGEKGATKLITEYGNLENVIDRAEEIKGAIGERFRQNIESAKKSKILATINVNVPINKNSESYEVKSWDKEKLSEIFHRYNFRNLSMRLTNTTPAIEKNCTEPIHFAAVTERAAGNIDFSNVKPAILLNTENDIAVLEKALKYAKDTIIIIPNIMGNKLYGLLINTNNNNFYIEFAKKMAKQGSLFDDETETFNAKKLLIPLVKKLKTGVKISGHNIKDTLLLLYDIEKYDYQIEFDVQIASYVIDPTKGHELDEIAYRHYGVEIGGINSSQKEKDSIDMNLVGKWLYTTNELITTLKSEMEKYKVSALYTDIEEPLISILADMEWTGVKIDVGLLQSLSKQMAEEINILEKNIHQQADEEFTINSPKQLQVILFDKLNLTSGRKTKTGFSTDASTLLSLIDTHPIIEMVIRYRELTKLKSTYVDALPKLIAERDGRVHTHFNQAVTATGRLSSSDPNLQNIPIRTEESRQIRKAFIAKDDDHLILAADYSQIELRVLADITKDENLTQIFLRDEDLHTATAKLLFNVSDDSVTREMRRMAKIVNFSIPYGTSAFGLASQIHTSRVEAAELRNNYLERFTNVAKYMCDIVDETKISGEVRTLLNRRRPIPEINASNANIRQAAERTAINTPIQGTAADIMKLAMIRVNDSLKKVNIDAKMILQIHDEIVMEVSTNDIDKAKEILLKAMQNSYELNVPLKADAKPAGRSLVED